MLKFPNILSDLNLLPQHLFPSTVLPARTTNIDIALGTLACFFFFFLVTQWTRIPKGSHLPPGPPGKAILGNVSDIPKKQHWETYTHWAKKYGDLVYIEILRQPIVLINSVAVAHELFEKKSSLYSDRPDFPMVGDLMGFNWSFTFMHYGDKWRRHRKLFHQRFHPTATISYRPIQIKRTNELLYRLHESPNDFFQHLRHLPGALIMEIIYGIKVLPTGDPYLRLAEDAMAVGGLAANPGSFLVDTLPILKYVPEWMPGAGFKRKARIWRQQLVTQMPLVPFNACKKALREGKATPSYIASFLESLTHQQDVDVQQEEEAIRNTGAAAYGAGADTTAVALSWFMLAMILYPDVQRKAQAELDKVVGADRLPTFEDRENLPYMNALCKEIHRWHPVSPLGIAHRLMQDDLYNTNFIPKGTVVIGNTWAMLHDENTYGPNPEHFEPERFFRPGVSDPSVAFGFGRRKCPGRDLVEDTIYIAACSILKVFNISHAKDVNGIEIPLDLSATSGAISRPNPFQCSITPRATSSERFLEHYQEDEL